MKLKTHKQTAKKVRTSGGKTKKYLTKKAGQDHFNAREPGNVTRAKRTDKQIAKVDQKNVKRLIPYS